MYIPLKDQQLFTSVYKSASIPFVGLSFVNCLLPISDFDHLGFFHDELSFFILFTVDVCLFLSHKRVLNVTHSYSLVFSVG